MKQYYYPMMAVMFVILSFVTKDETEAIYLVGSMIAIGFNELINK